VEQENVTFALKPKKWACYKTCWNWCRWHFYLHL
jgi:hypothetical protein